MFHQKKKQIVV